MKKVIKKGMFFSEMAGKTIENPWKPQKKHKKDNQGWVKN